MNKRAEFDGGWFMKVILIIFGIVFVLISLPMISHLFGMSCEVEAISELKGFNGISDKDTGLFSSGSVDRNTFFFENGMIIETHPLHKGDIDNLVLGEPYKIKRCRTFTGQKYWEIER